jgi:hypothetical protein
MYIHNDGELCDNVEQLAMKSDDTDDEEQDDYKKYISLSLYIYIYIKREILKPQFPSSHLLYLTNSFCIILSRDQRTY